MAEINPFVVFEVRLDKDRGIIILPIRKLEHENVYFFRFHHQQLDCHPEQVQAIVRSHKVTVRTKSIKEMKINKEAGLLKRKQATGTKKETQMEKIRKKLQEEEAQFQLNRAQRIAEVNADIQSRKSANNTE
ncbi:hypothetical protein Bhyg_02978, partial [Pseudolycoriella hygida]